MVPVPFSDFHDISENVALIGSAIAFKFASEGAKVVVVDVLEEMGQRAVDKIKGDGGEGLFVRTDASRTDEVRRAIEITKETFGKLHCLVNCAASYRRATTLVA